MSTRQQVPFYRHQVGAEEKSRILAALDDPILTTGQTVTETEDALAKYLGLRHVVCLDSCTAALHLALVAYEIGPGEEVVVPAMTFVATANAALMAGARPVFADVDPQTGCITPETIAAKITTRTRAIIPVHLFGLLCDMPAIRALADRHNLVVIEDSAHCLEARRDDVRPGSHSHCACFSFYATKNITCGEGGALATNDPELAERVRCLSRHGITTSAYDRYGKRYQQWDMPAWGWKYNLDNIRASLLLPQIRRLDGRWQRRRAVAEMYEQALADLPDVEYPRVAQPAWSARHLFPIWVPAERRNDVLDGLQQRGVGTVVNYTAVHLLEFYRRAFGHQRGDLPAAESIGDRTLSLPFYPQLTRDQVEYVVDCVAAALGTPRAPQHCNEKLEPAPTQPAPC